MVNVGGSFPGAGSLPMTASVITEAIQAARTNCPGPDNLHNGLLFLESIICDHQRSPERSISLRCDCSETAWSKVIRSRQIKKVGDMPRISESRPNVLSLVASKPNRQSSPSNETAVLQIFVASLSDRVIVPADWQLGHGSDMTIVPGVGRPGHQRGSMTAFEQRHLDSIARKKIGPDLTAVITTEAYQSSVLKQNVNVMVYYYEGGGLKRKLGSGLTDSGTPLSTTSESRDRDEGDRPDDGSDPACRLGWGDAKPEEVGGAAEQRTSDRYN